MKIIDLSLPLDERYHDFHPPRHPDFNLEVFALHRTLLGGGVPVIEFVCNLHRLPGTGFRIIALPLPMAGAGGSPVRTVGVVE